MNLKFVVSVVIFSYSLFSFIAFANASPPFAKTIGDVSHGTTKKLGVDSLDGKVVLKDVGLNNWLGGKVVPEEVEPSNWCGTGNPHPIDVELHQQRYKEDVGTADIRAAQGRAHTAWDSELKSLYTRLYVLLGRKNRRLLQKSQQAWKGYAAADAEWVLSSAMISSCYGGTLGPVYISDRHLEMKRQRACDLYLFRQCIEQGYIEGL